MKGPGTPRSRGSGGPGRGVGWIPAFLLGASAAVAGELAAALLLYSGDGLLPSLTVVLATETGALAAGLVFSRGLRPWDLDGLRYRWLLAVISFGGAAVFAGAWGLGAGFSASALSQGMGLALLAALPFFSTGAVLGALAGSAPIPEPADEPAEGGRLLHGGGASGTGIAAWASFGAAAGFVLTGVYGLAEFLPASLLLFCVVVTSAAALLHGWLVDRSVVVRPLAAAGSDAETKTGEPDRLHLERWSRARPPLELIVLRAGERLADAREVAQDDEAPAGPDSRRGGVVLPWERQVLDLLHDAEGSARGEGRALVVGAGTGALSTGLAEGGRWKVETVDPRPLPRSLGAWRSGPLHSTSGWEERHRGRHDAVIVNVRLLPGSGHFGCPSRAAVVAAAECRKAGGLLLLGGVYRRDGAEPDPVPGWLTDLLGSPPSPYHPGAGSWSRDASGTERVLGRLGRGGGLLVHGTSPLVSDPEGETGGPVADGAAGGAET